MAVTLPTKPQDPDVRLESFRWLIYGDPKSGKTSLVSEFPNVLLMATERGYAGLRVSVLDIRTWEDICDACDALVDRKAHKYETVGIDTAEALYQIICTGVAEEAGVEDVGRIAHGAGWNEANKRLKMTLDCLTDAGLCVVTTCHAIQTKVDQGFIEIQKWMPSLSASGRRVLMAWADMILYIQVVRETVKGDDDGEEIEQLQRYAICTPLPEVEAGGRIVGMEPRVLLTPDPTTGFGRLAKEFKRAAAAQLAALHKKTSRTRRRR